jgi:hypothetical protein
MRTPWQSFRVDLGRAPVRLWAALGRLEAYGDVLRRLPAAPGTAAETARAWREQAARATLAAEAAAAGLRHAEAAEPALGPASGRTRGAAQAGLPSIDPDAAAALAALYDDIDRQEAAGQGRLTPQTLCADNAALGDFARAAGLLGGGMESPDSPDASLAGQLADGPGSWGRLNQLCAWLNGPEFEAARGEEVQTAALRALGAHLFLLRLSPFRHCNEATARLAGYRLLRAAGLPAMVAHLPAAHFAATAGLYAELIAEAAESGGATFAFIAYAVDGISAGLIRQIAAIGAAQQGNVWRDRIADAFDGRTRAGDRRRRMLVEALARETAPVRIGRLRYMTPKLAEAYAGKSVKTLSRDVKWLEAKGLVRRTLQGVQSLRDDDATAARAA